MLQAGIDIAGLMLDQTHSFTGGGGKVGGRKFLVAFAGKMFGTSAYPVMDGYLAQPGLPAGAPTYIAPRWCVWRQTSNGWGPYERFQEDCQFFQPDDPLESDPSLRVDWEWTGSPWMYSSTRGDRSYQHMDPQSHWPVWWNPHAGEPKRWTSTAVYAPLGIALRLLDMQEQWRNSGSPGMSSPNPSLWDLLHGPLANDALHPFFGYIDRMMVPQSNVANARYAMAGHTYYSPPTTPLPQGIGCVLPNAHSDCPRLQQREVVEWNTNNPFRANDTLAMDLWDRYRTEAKNAIEVRPSSFTFATIAPSAPGCPSLTATTHSPTLLCQFPPRASKPVLIEMYAAEPFQGAPSASQPWVALMAYSDPVPPWPYTLGSNTVQLYVAQNAPTVFGHTNSFGFLGVPFDLTGAPIGLQIAFQAVYTNFDGSNCVAASNALVLTVQP